MTPDNITQTVSNILTSITSSGWFLVIKFTFLSLILFFIGFLIFVFTKTTWFSRLILWDFKEYLTFRHYGLPRIERKWIKIRERLEAKTEPEAKLAVIEAEALLDDILKKEGFLGRTFDERLNKLSTDIIANLEELKEAHQVRSDIVHDPTYRLDLKEAERILNIYEKSLVELQAL